MPWIPPTFTPGVVWQDSPNFSTPLDALNLNLEENAEATYAAQVGQSIVNYFAQATSPFLPGGAVTPWLVGSTYVIGQWVSRSGSLYVSNTNGNIGHDPATDVTFVNWTPQIPLNTVVSSTGVYNLGTDAFQNMAIGVPFLNIQPGPQPTAAQYNVALGWEALRDLTTGNYNTGLGVTAGQQTTTGIGNTFVGTQAGQGNTIGDNNTAVGQTALQVNKIGNENTAIGWNTLTKATASFNTAVGENALTNQTTPSFNTAFGQSAGTSIVTGGGVTHIGFQAGRVSSDVNYTTLLGFKTNATGSGGVAIGVDSSGTGATAAGNVIALGTANHQVQVLNNATGAGSAALGANCPAVTATAPYTWLRMKSGDGSTVYVPAWK